MALKVDDTITKEKIESADMVEVFEGVANVVVENLEKLIEQEREEEKVGYGDLMNDFATEEFLNKNIRVRPVSGFVKDEGADLRSSQSRGNLTTENED